MLLPWCVSLAIGVASAFLLKPVYVSTARITLESGQQVQGPFGTLSSSALQQQAELMRDQVQGSLFLKAVIAASGLREDPATIAWAKSEAERPSGMSEDDAIDAFLVDHFRDAVSIGRNPKSLTYTVTVSDEHPARAQKVCAAIAEQFVASSKSMQIEAVRAQQEFSVEQLQIYKRSLQEAESRLEAARRSAISTQIAGSFVHAGNYGYAQALVEQANGEINDMQDRLTEIRSQFAGRLRENDPAALVSSTVSTLAGQISGLERQLGMALLAEGSGASGGSSGSGALRVSMARKTSELDAELSAVAASALPGLAPDARDLAVRYRIAQLDVQAKRGWRDWLSGQIATYQRQMVSAPDRELDVSRLSAEVEQARTLYTTFQTQSAAAQVAEAFQNAKVSGRFRIVEPANRPLRPSKPNKPVLVILAFLVGGVIGVGTVLVVEQSDQSVKNADEVENLLGLPVLGAVPRVEELERRPRKVTSAKAAPPAGLPAARDPGLIQRLKMESPLGLEFKRIYLTLSRARGRSLPRSIMITSSTRGEGKTTTSACLGITLAREHRQRTLLVDFDLRSPALHRALGLPSSSWGVSQMLQKREFDERFIRQTSLSNLDFLSTGRADRPPAELIDHDAVTWFLGEALNRYDLVVLDTAPNLAVPDPLIIGPLVEGVIFVVKAGATVRKAAEYGVRLQREARENLLGALMNDIGEYLPQYYGYKAQYYGYTTTEAAGGDPH